MPVSGKFGVTIGDRSLMGVDADITADNFRELLNLAFFDEGGKAFSVMVDKPSTLVFLSFRVLCLKGWLLCWLQLGC